MSFLTLGLNQTCTHWKSLGVDGYNQPTFDVPRGLDCRWEQRNEKIQSDEGVEIVSRARIFLAEDIEVGDYLALGEFDDENPKEVFGAYRVLAFRKIPDLMADDFERKAYL